MHHQPMKHLSTTGSMPPAPQGFKPKAHKCTGIKNLHRQREYGEPKTLTRVSQQKKGSENTTRSRNLRKDGELQVDDTRAPHDPVSARLQLNGAGPCPRPKRVRTGAAPRI